MTAPFNGGKMQHIFKFDDATRMYTDEYISEEAQAALLHGKAFFKIDGSNGIIKRHRNEQRSDKNDDGGIDTLIPYQRLDTKGKPFPESCTELPDGKNQTVYAGHTYCYEPITRNVAGKKAIKRNAAMIQVVEDNAEYLKETFMKDGITNFVSIEWVGTKFQKTPGVSDDVAVAVHAQQVCDDDFERTYGGVKKYLDETVVVEGLLFSHDGMYWKVRSDCFNRKCSFATKRETTRPPVILRLKIDGE